MIRTAFVGDYSHPPSRAFLILKPEKVLAVKKLLHDTKKDVGGWGSGSEVKEMCAGSKGTEQKSA